jgi:hypothetical protein
MSQRKAHSSDTTAKKQSQNRHLGLSEPKDPEASKGAGIGSNLRGGGEPSAGRTAPLPHPPRPNRALLIGAALLLGVWIVFLLVLAFIS